MPSNYTENYQLSQWEAGDKVQRADFNSDNAKIDAALAGLDSAKADASALNSLAQTVSGQGAELDKKGNCRVGFYTYIGTGGAGAENYCYIPFTEGEPVMVLVMGGGRKDLLFHRGTSELVPGTAIIRVGWSASGVSWYAYNSTEDQLNYKDVAYTAIMFYKLD